MASVNTFGIQFIIRQGILKTVKHLSVFHNINKVKVSHLFNILKHNVLKDKCFDKICLDFNTGEKLM
jgi:hypothetical protein